LVSAASAAAGPIALDRVLCRRLDNRFDGETKTIVSVPRAPGPTATANDDGSKLAVCDAAKTSCVDVPTKGVFQAAVSPDGKRLLVASNDGDSAVLAVPSGKATVHFDNRRDRTYTCGAGLWLGNDVILAFGNDCSEFDAKPFLAHARSGKYIAAFVSKKLTENGETLYDAAPLDGKLWAVAMFDHYEKDSYGTVYAIDTATGKIRATATGTAAGGATIVEGKTTRTIDKIADCR